MKTKLGRPEQILKRWRPGRAQPGQPIAQIIDLFSGAGGMSLGFSAVGQQSGAFRLLGGVDINETSTQTYAKNFGVPGLSLNVRDLATNERLLKEFLRKVGYDPSIPLVLIGCAPCQGFSAHKKKTWDQPDERNDLVEVFAKIVVKLNPAFVVMENVPELLSGKYWKHFAKFKATLESVGYVAKQSIHNSAEYGTPQERFRALVIASDRHAFSLPSAVFEATAFRTVRDAIGDLPEVQPGVPLSTDPFHRSAGHRQSTLEILEAIPKNGGSRPRGIGPKCLDKIKGFSDVYGRLHWERPSITITHYARNPASGRYVHPEQNRGLTMREAARLQGFPDRFEFVGSFDDVFRQIGEAVPPHLAVATATAILKGLEGYSHSENEGIIESPVSNSYASVIAGIKTRRRE